MKLYEKIYTLRTEKKLSQGDLAEMLNVSRQSVSKWETGASVPDLDKLIKMKDIFGISIDELVCEEIVEKKSEELTETVVKTESSPQIVVVKESVQMRKLVGLLMFFGAFFMLIFGGYDFAVYLTVMGILCLVCQKRSWIWCLWISFFTLGYGGTISVFDAFRFRWYDYYIERGMFLKEFLPAWLYFIGFVVLVAITAWSFRRYRLSPMRSRNIILGIGWCIILSVTPILQAIFSHILEKKMQTWILNPEEVAVGATPVYSGELHQEWVTFENLFYDIFEVFFVAAFCAMVVLTFALIRTYLAKKKVSVPDETA